MSKFPIGPEPAHFGATSKARVVRVDSGDPIYYGYAVDSKGKLLKKGKSVEVTKDVWLRSKGQSVVSLTQKR